MGNTVPAEGHIDYVNSVAFNPNGSILASGSEDKTIKLWDTTSFDEIATLGEGGHTDLLKSVAFSPNGSILASGSFDKTIKLWSDPKDPKELVKLSDTKLYLPIYEGVLGTLPLTIEDIEYLTIDLVNGTSPREDKNIFLNVYFERLDADGSVPRLDYYLGQGGLVNVNWQNPDEGVNESGNNLTTPGDAKTLYDEVKAQKITRIFISTSTTAKNSDGSAKAPPELDITLFNASLKVKDCQKPFNIAFTKDKGLIITSGSTAEDEAIIYETTVAGGKAPYKYSVSDGFNIDATGLVTASQPLPVGEQTFTVEVVDANDKEATKEVALDVYRKLVANDAAEGDSFGSSVAISGGTVVVGAYGDNGFSGSAYVFERSGPGTWTQENLVANDAEPKPSSFALGDNFGSSVAISDGTIVVGAYADDDDERGINSGSVYVFEKKNGVWTQEKLFANDAAKYDYFGRSVAISGGTVVVGADGDDGLNGDKSRSGSAYVFERSGSGTWTQEKLVADDAAKDDKFGRSVAISDGTVVVGAYADDDDERGTNSGSAYVFEKKDGAWTQEKLFANDAAEFDIFGQSVAIDGDTIVVGARGHGVNGAAYVFERSGPGTWTQEKLVANDAAENDYFGRSVAISGNTIVIGAAEEADVSPEDPGSAYVFQRSEDGAWTQTKKLTAVDAGVDDFFGSSVAISDGTIVVGAENNNDFSGSAYVYGIKSKNNNS